MLLDNKLHGIIPVSKTSTVHCVTRNRQLLSGFFTLCCIFLLVNIASAQQKSEHSFASATGKKLIEYGWDQFFAADPTFIRDNIREMEEQPFEGIAFRLPAHESNIFDVKDWQADKATEQNQLKVLSSIKWDKFTDNFLAIYASSTMNWHSDSDWDKILYKVRYNSKAAVAAGCVGIVFDPESYGRSPWNYSRQEQKEKYSYVQYSEKIYQRGQQFMEAMQSEMPNVKLLMFFQYSTFYYANHDSDPFARNAGIDRQNYGLMLPFIDGMLSVAGPKVQLIDGNENSYYFTTAERFYRAYWEMRQGARVAVKEDLKTKFDSHVRAAQALYADYPFGLVTFENFVPDFATVMTPEERAMWFEQNVYSALQSSDEYVWLYTEKMDFFNHPVLPGDSDRDKEWKSVPPPPGLIDAINSARKKLIDGKSLGFSMDDVIENARKKLK